MRTSVSISLGQLSPFMWGLDGSLSDSTMTSSGDGGRLSFLMSLGKGRGRAIQRESQNFILP